MGYVKVARLFAYSYTYRDYTYLYICGTACYVIVNVLFSNALSTVLFYLERERERENPQTTSIIWLLYVEFFFVFVFLNKQ